MKICGIDPGNSGALCVLDISVSPVHICFLDIKKHTAYEIGKWLHEHLVQSVWIEDVHSLYGMSAKSNFGFGRSVGTITAIAEITTKGKPVNKVTPKVWQKNIGVTSKGKDIKYNVAKLALELYPAADIYGKQGGLLDGRSDALMIAHYGINH